MRIAETERVADRQRRYVIRAAIEHHLHGFRVELGAVLDGRHPTQHGILDALGGDRVGGHAPALTVGLVADRLDFFEGVVARVGRRLHRKHSARGEDLQKLGSGADGRAGCFAAFVHAVGRRPALFEHRRHEHVVVAAGHAEDHRRRDDARTETDALLDSVVQRRVATHIWTAGLHRAQGGEPGVERLLDIGQRVIRPQRRVQRQVMPADVLAAQRVHRRVDVRIHQTRHEGLPVQIDDGGVGWHRLVGADRGNRAAVDDYRRAGQRHVRLSVEHTCIGKRQRHHALLIVATQGWGLFNIASTIRCRRGCANRRPG